MQGISHTRLLIYCLVLGILPIVFVASHYMMQKSQQDRLEYAISDALRQAHIKNAREFQNKQVKAIFREHDHFYIDKEIETIIPLKDEIEALQKVLQRGFHPDEDQFRKRLVFLTNGQNAISFVEGSVKASPGFQETTENLAHPIEADLSDIKRILSRVEGVSLDEQNQTLLRPHLFITEMKMEKKRGVSQELYTVDLKLVKREYLK